jgi:hypothetical protein
MRKFKIWWESNHSFVGLEYPDGEGHLFPWDGKQLGEDWMTPAAASLPLDPEHSLSEAVKHSPAARAAAETFAQRR